MSILITLLTNQWFWTAVVVPFVLWLLTKVGKNYDAEKVKKAMDILYQLVVFACNLAETESKKGNMLLSKKDFVIQYIKQNAPDIVRQAIPNFLDIVQPMIEKYLVSDESPDSMTPKAISGVLKSEQ